MIKKLRLLVSILFVMMFLFLWSVPSAEAVTATDNTKVIFGDKKNIGNGTVRTWLKVDKSNGKPLSLGVSLSESALTGLPGESDPAQAGSLKLQLMDGSVNHTYEYELMFPKEAEDTAYTHMGFNWNPVGHGPEVFEKAHFDVHFYMGTPEYRHKIVFDVKKVEDKLQVETSNLVPPKQFLPINYELAPNTAEPRMGSHYADMTSEQLIPGKFENIFLFGVHNGLVLFWEPMITLEHLKTKPSYTRELNQPAAYPVSGFYPMATSLIYDEKNKEFDISLDNLVFRAPSFPDNFYGVQPCIDTRMASIVAKFGRVPFGSVAEKCIDTVVNKLKK